MLRIDRQARTLKRLEQRQLPQAGLKERYDIQQMILNSPDDFFAEMGEPLLVLGQEVRPADFVDDRIDLLAIDQQGAAVIIELKRGTDKLQLLQALSYAAMVARWDREQLVNQRAQLTGKSFEDAEDDVEQYLLEDIGDLNQTQRVLLLAEDFDYEVLITAEWLTEQYTLDIRCYRLTLSADQHTEFLSCTCIFPPPEITQHAVRRSGRREGRPIRWPDWQAALKSIDNPAVVQFFERELSSGRPSYLRKRELWFAINGKRRFHVGAKRKHAYVWQLGRFKDDERFWIENIGSHIEVKPVREDKTCLRFFLTSEQDFARFTRAVEADLLQAEFLAPEDVSDLEEEEQ